MPIDTFGAMSLQITLLTKKDIPVIIPLVQQLNPEKSVALLHARLTEMFDYQSYRCFGAHMESGQLVAVSSAWISTKLYSGKQVEVDNVVVDVSARGKGIGDALMHHIEEWAIGQDCESVELNAYIKNTRAHDFYERRGFKKVGFHMIKEPSSRG